MFEYFPGQYVWNLATSMAINLGANMSEIDDACHPLRERKEFESSEAIDSFFAAWLSAGRKAVDLARQDEARGNYLAAGNKYKRAAIYLLTAERMQSHKSPGRLPTYREALECFSRFVRYREENCVRVEIPYKGTSLPALFVQAPGSERTRAPCMVHFDGFDATKELIYMTGVAGELTRRGVSCLIVDHPGVGEALRLRNLAGFPETEVPATAAVDYLVGRPEVDPQRIGIMALSLGGYYAPRAAAFEKRFKCCVAWGAMHDFGKRFRLRMEGRGERSVPQFIEHGQWVFGTASAQETLKLTAQMSLEGVAQQIECPILIVHGENDRQVPLEQARATYEACTASPKRELRINTLQEGGAEHCSIDNFSLSIDYMTDWIAKTL
jgi:dienelactone hydrolase